jgi:hypothetical protein
VHDTRPHPVRFGSPHDDDEQLLQQGADRGRRRQGRALPARCAGQGRRRRRRDPALFAAHPAREPPALRGRQDRPRRRRPGRRRLEPPAARRARGPAPAGARADAGLHRRARGLRPRGDARRVRQARPTRQRDQPAQAGRSGDRSLGPDRRVRHQGGVPAQRRPRVPAQPRALPVPALGPAGVRQHEGRAARHRDLPPGQPRVPRPGRVHRDLRRPRRRLPRLAGRHRLAHHHGQRPGRVRLGRRRHRGRGRDARPADGDADPRGHRLRAHRPTPRRRHRHRPGPHRHPDAAQEGCGRQVRRVHRIGPGVAVAPRPRDHRQHGARVRRDDGVLPGRRRDPRVPAVHRPQRRPRPAGRALHQGEPPLARSVGQAAVRRHPVARPVHRRAVARRPRPAPGSGPAGDLAPRVAPRGRRPTPARAATRVTRPRATSAPPAPSPPITAASSSATAPS